MIQLRPYQETAIDNVRSAFRRNVRSALLVAPTGSGKTVMFSHLSGLVAARDKRITIVAHREELLDQISKTLTDFDVKHSYIAANRPYDSVFPVQVASVQTLARRLDRYPAPDLLVIDEAHHAVSATQWGRIVREYSKAYILGVTATPCRLSGEGLGDLFHEMILGPTVQELIALGSLCDYRPFVPSTFADDGMHSRGGDYVREEAAAKMDKPTVTGDAVKHYRRLSHQKPAVAFCVRVDHAEHVARQFKEAGYSAASVDGGMDKDERRRIIMDFSSGHINVLTSCDLISEGFDVPGIETAILLRPTQSLGLYLQQVGRALRPARGKEYATILDHCGNIARHGLPDDDREWTLESVKRTKVKTDNESSVKVCKNCFAAMRSTQMKCRVCGIEVIGKPREVVHQEGELIELDKERARKELRKQQGAAKTIDELVEYGKARGYKNPYGWAKHVLNARSSRK